MVVVATVCWIDESLYFLPACGWLGLLRNAIVMIAHKLSSFLGEVAPSCRLAIRELHVLVADSQIYCGLIHTV